MKLNHILAAKIRY